MFENGNPVQQESGQPEQNQNQQPDQGQPSQDWRSQIPAELRDAPQLKDVKDLGSLAKQFVDQQRFLGNSIRIPGEDAGPESRQEFIAKLQKHAPDLIRRPDPSDEAAMAEFWAQAGVPNDPAAYEVEEGVTLPEERLTNIKALARKYGLTKDKFRQFVKDTVAQETAAMEQAQQSQQEDFKALASEWGHATEGRINDIKKFAEVMQLPEGFRNALQQGQVGSEWLKAMHNIIQQFGGMRERSEVAFQPGGSIPDSPAELKAKIAEIEANPAFLNNRAPQHQGLVQKRFELIQQYGQARQSN